MGWVGVRGNALVGYAHAERWDEAYLVCMCVLLFLLCCFSAACIIWLEEYIVLID